VVLLADGRTTQVDVLSRFVVEVSLSHDDLEHIAALQHHFNESGWFFRAIASEEFLHQEQQERLSESQ
jgi:hypothetical protein